VSEAVRREPGISGLSLVFSAWHDPVARILNVDLLTVLIAILLPWSTTGVVIAAVLWIIALIPTLEVRAFLRSLTRPICVLPIAFLALALVGTLWSDALWNERLFAVRPTAKLLVLPLLLYHFERSTRGVWVFIAFLASCTLLMAASWLVAFDPAFTLKATGDRVCGVFVKNYIDQSQEFVLCAIALAYPVMILLKEKKRLLAGLLVAIALSFIVNMVFVIASRMALATMPIMIFVFALLHLKWRSIVLVSMITVIAGLAWAT
jgi:O-antigen ligase